jgi:putative restriction endonuclease
MATTYLEMSRNEDHGGGAWAFTNCVWAPTEKKGGGDWPFWNKVLHIIEGDIVLHLRGITPNARFVGYSIASGNGFRTTKRPPIPSKWDYANSFYRADLTGFTPFHQPINLADLFAFRQVELNTYFDSNEKSGAEKSNIFFVRQSGRLQCLNGAYLSDVDDELLTSLFGEGEAVTDPKTKRVVLSVETGSQISTVRSRLGQARFASEVKDLYGNKCCFPGCTVSDSRFLVGSHIARWSDNEQLRGKMGNGLCLCLMHDKAFETGIFTLDEYYKVFVNPKERTSDSQFVRDLIVRHGEQIRVSEVKPLEDALLEHWIRVGIEP